MPTEGRAKFLSPQNTAGVSQEKDISIISLTIEVNGDKVSNTKEYKINHKMSPYCPEASIGQVVLMI